MRPLALVILCFSIPLFSQTVNVTTNADSGGGSLRQAITNINAGSDASNTINLQIPGNSPISVGFDLPVIKKNTTINSTGQQPINGQGQYRLFATIMADLSLTNCNLDQGAAIGGNGNAGGMGAGGGIYIDRGNTLTLSNTKINTCKAQGGIGQGGYIGGGGASFSTLDKHASANRGGGDYPGLTENGQGGAFDGSTFLTGYGGGDGGARDPDYKGLGGGNGSGQNGLDNPGSKGGNGGYCGGGGGGDNNKIFVNRGAGGGGNGGGSGIIYNSGNNGGGGGGGFGSGGSNLKDAKNSSGGGGGFGGGGGSGGRGGGGGFGGGGAAFGGTGGRFGGNGNDGGGAGLGGAIFVGDTATCIIQDNVSISGNSVLGGSGGNPGQGYAPDIFLFREAKVVFDNTQPLAAPYSIMADQMAPAGHLDNGIVKQGPGQLTLSNPDNNYRGGTSIEGGTLSVTDPKALGSQTAPITLDGGTLQPTKTMTLTNPIAVNGTGGIDTPGGTTLTTTGNISGSGTIDKTNAGTWKQTGTSTHTGDLNVNQGTLQVDGTLPSNININPGGILQGNGIAGGNVTNNGTVRPGDNAIGTLTIGGDYTQTPNGTLDIELKPNGISDKLNVNGTATLDGHLNLILLPGIYPQSDPYVIINANPINGNFTSVSSNSSFPAEALITPNQFIITLSTQIVFPIANNKLPNNQKNLANYLFCDNFPFENDNLVNLLQTLFQLPVSQYIKTLATMTPEQYGALPITEKNNIQYLLSLKQQSCIEAYQYCIVTPLFYTDHYQKDSHLPNYVQNTGGVSLTYQTNFPTKMAAEIAATYLNTHIEWADRKGRSVSNAFYFAPSLLCKANGIDCKMTVLGSYNLHHVDRRIIFPTPLHTQANCKSWNLAESVSLSYNHTYRRKVIIIPSLVLSQSNIFSRKISENKPQGLNLQTESKTHSYLDTIISLGFKTKRQRPSYCAIPSITLGWHNVWQLTDSRYTSRLDNYTACEPNFSTKTYSANRDRFFIEGSVNIAHVFNWGINHSARVEFGDGDLILAVNLSFDWAF